MSDLEILGRHISNKIKRRAREYFEENAVRILYTDSEYVSAQVTGSQEYAVDLERDQGFLVYACECPFFEENFTVCKHIWATLLELEHQGYLVQWKSQFPVKMIPTSPDDGFTDAQYDDDADYENETIFASGYEADERDLSNQRGGALPLSPSWKHLLKTVNRRMDSSRNLPEWPSGREIVYIIDLTDRIPEIGRAHV